MPQLKGAADNLTVILFLQFTGIRASCALLHPPAVWLELISMQINLFAWVVVHIVKSS